MHLPALRDGFLHHGLEVAERKTLADTHPGCQLLDRRLRTHPDDIIHGHIVAEEILLVGIHINDARISGMSMAEEIQKGTVLTELIGVVGIIGRSLVIS